MSLRQLRRWAGPPSPPAVIFLLFAGVAAFGAQREILNLDGDLPRHLRHGEFMLAQHALIRSDPFSFTRAGQPFVPFEYGSQLIFALVHRAGGLAGVALFSALVIGLSWALTCRFLLRRGVDPALALLVTAMGGVLSAFHWGARPHLFTLLLAALLLPLLEDQGRKHLAAIAAIFIVWANLQGGWIYGLALIALYAVGSVAEMVANRAPDERARWRQSTARYVAIFGVALAATFLSPSGWRVHRHVLWFFRQSYLLNHTGEFVSPNFHDFPEKIFLAALLLVIAGLAFARRRPNGPRLLVILAHTAWALNAVRNIELFGLVALPVAALHLDPAWRALPDPRRFRAGFARSALASVSRPWMAAGGLALVALGLNHGLVAGRALVADGFDPTVFPVRAVAAARAAGLAGPVFSSFTWGGYILYAWPEQKVFIDGGTDFYGPGLMRQYADVVGLQPGWRSTLDRWGIQLVLMPGQSRLVHELFRDPRWGVWHCDSTAVLLRRAAPTATGFRADADATLDRCAPRTPAASGDEP